MTTKNDDFLLELIFAIKGNNEITRTYRILLKNSSICEAEKISSVISLKKLEYLASYNGFLTNANYEKIIFVVDLIQAEFGKGWFLDISYDINKNPTSTARFEDGDVVVVYKTKQFVA